MGKIKTVDENSNINSLIHAYCYEISAKPHMNCSVNYYLWSGLQ